METKQEATLEELSVLLKKYITPEVREALVERLESLRQEGIMTPEILRYQIDI